MPENTIQNYINKIEGLKEEVDKSKPKILGQIDLKLLLTNPKEYLQDFAMDFYDEHEKELREAVDAGEPQAKRIIGLYGKDNQKRSI